MGDIGHNDRSGEVGLSLASISKKAKESSGIYSPIKLPMMCGTQEVFEEIMPTTSTVHIHCGEIKMLKNSGKSAQAYDLKKALV